MAIKTQLTNLQRLAHMIHPILLLSLLIIAFNNARGMLVGEKQR
ncbi:leu operon leader peptide [Xenorhabdus sp. BG5]|nr:leu operon leader peptide [Xenorhabdus sp. BG5]